uniref:peroxidase n=1 Tax=Ananas comosus var. bracteatus TaxID=296719 RepID=A0A6V7PCL6_ANACO|nr:unnamed protein product [Ananas comosus var. bracteatus]
MTMRSSNIVAFSWMLFILALQAMLPISSASLQVGFYAYKCNKTDVELLVRGVVEKAVRKNPGVGAGLIRMYFHDCFVRPATPPSAWATSTTPSPRAAATASSPSNPKSSRTAGPFFSLSQNEAFFWNKGMTPEEMVTLSGAHSIGRSHCSSFTDRLYPTQDPTMNSSFAGILKGECPQNAAVDGVVPQDIVTPNRLSNQYYKNVKAHKVLFTTDQNLLTSSDTAAEVEENAKNPAAWKAKFAAAMVKMGNLVELTGTQGQIRKKCSAVN